MILNCHSSPLFFFPSFRNNFRHTKPESVSLNTVRVLLHPDLARTATASVSLSRPRRFADLYTLHRIEHEPLPPTTRETVTIVHYHYIGRHCAWRFPRGAARRARTRWRNSGVGIEAAEEQEEEEVEEEEVVEEEEEEDVE